MEVRRILASILLTLACFFAGFMSRAPYQNSPRKCAHTTDETSIATSTKTKEHPADNAGGSNDDSPDWYAAFKRPDGMLVLVGIATFIVIAWQAWETRKSAEVASKNIDLQKAAMEQWIDTSGWEARTHNIQPTATEAELKIKFRLENPTKFPLTLNVLLLWINRQHVSTVLYGNPLLVPPDKHIPVPISLRLEGQRLADYQAAHLVLEIGGLVHFIDAFKEKQKRTFGVICICGPNDRGNFDICAFTPPDDEELETRKRMLERIEKIGKKKRQTENPN